MQAGNFNLRSIGPRGIVVALLATAALWMTGAAQAANPIDRVSNPERLNYPDVEMELPDYDEPFQRPGVMTQTQRFQQIVAGLPAQEVVRLIGQPLEADSKADAWHYNFTFQLPHSQNYLVCQYTVVLEGEHVKTAAWRRRQCLDLVNAVP
ncbi:MAG: hypothetical protein M0Q54_01600 [Pigmentiphaga sp.]|nr:hypothetical protein [Pigmentiphaga sp.]